MTNRFCIICLFFFVSVAAFANGPMDNGLPTASNAIRKVGACYYVGGLDAPFPDMDAVNRLKLEPGDSVCFAGGQTFEGTLRVHPILGTKEKPLFIGSFGKGRAIIHGKSAPAIIIDTCTYVSVGNLTVQGNGRLAGSESSGIEVKNSCHVQIDRVEAFGFLWNGVSTYGGNDLKLTRIYAHDNGSNGIEVSGPWSHKEVKNVYIADCVAENNPGNPRVTDNHSGSGILVAHSTNVLIEKCEAMNNGWDMPRPGNGPVGIWAYECDSLTIQYCYAHDNKTSAKGRDGGGFDFDGGITNSVMQYNLSMNNEGAGYGLFQFGGASAWMNNTVRYNVSINDGRKNSQAGIFVWCDPYNKPVPLCNSQIYRNVVINGYGHAVSFETGFSSGLVFRDNSFYLTNDGTKAVWGDYTPGGVLFQANNYWFEQAEKEGKPQPCVREDATAKYRKIEYRIPPNSSLQNVKEMVESLLAQKDR